MQRLITVKLADVFPLEDEYGNQYASRDYSTKANRDYVRELAESMRMRGIPDEPIAVVEDGGIYRIKTGNSRVMAMRELGTRECPAVVDDEDTVQSVLEAVVRTDTKKKYEDVEKSRFVQQLTMFGDDEYVSEVSGIEPQKVKRIRRARMVVDDAGDDMTLDRMLLIEEFADDPDAVRALTECREADARNVADSLRRGRKVRESKDAFAAALGPLGVPVSGDRDDVSGMSYFVSTAEPGRVADYLPPEWEPGQVRVLLVGCWDYARAEIYVAPELSGDADPETAERRRQEEAYRNALASMDEARFAWFWEGFGKGRPMPDLLGRCEHEFKRNYYVEQARGEMGEDAWAAAVNKGLSMFDYAIGFSAIDAEGIRFAGDLAAGKIERHRAGALAEYVDMLDVYMGDGWDPGDCTALVEKLRELFEGTMNGSEGDDE